MKILLLISTLSLLAVQECKNNTGNTGTEATTTAETPQKTGTNMKNSLGTLTLKEGENRFVKEFETNVTFQQVSEDSRCPKGVNCIWAGVAVADIQLMGIYTRPVTLKLATTDVPGRGYHNSAEFNGYKITLTELTPYPSAGNDSQSMKGKYVATISVSKAD